MNKPMFWCGLLMIGLEIITVIGKMIFDLLPQIDIAQLIFYVCLGLFNIAGIIFIFVGVFSKDKKELK